MKAIAADRIDSLADYFEVERPLPDPSAGQVRIKVAAIGIGYVDALVAMGRYQVKPPLPHIPGQELAGTIDAVGEGVIDWTPGDRVTAMTPHAFAEYALAPSSACQPLPAHVSFAQGAALPLNYLTALHGLQDRAALKPGETLLVFGAAGGVGSAAVQIGKRLGAHVIAAASTAEKRAFALAHSADAAIDTNPDGWRDRLKAMLAGKALGVIFDPLCGPLFEPAFRSLGWGGRHLVVGFVGGPIASLPSNLTLMKGAGLIGVDVRQFQLYEPDAAQVERHQLARWLATSSVSPAVGPVFAWSDYRAALETAFAGTAMGKVVLMVGTQP